MTYKKAYRIVKTAVSVFMIALFIITDSVVFYYGDYVLYLIFIPIELFFIFFWVFLNRRNKNSVVRINTKKGVINIITLSRDYTLNAEEITVSKGKFHYILSFKNTKLKANSLNKSVQSFIFKYQNIYKKSK